MVCDLFKKRYHNLLSSYAKIGILIAKLQHNQDFFILTQLSHHCCSDPDEQHTYKDYEKIQSLGPEILLPKEYCSTYERNNNRTATHERYHSNHRIRLIQRGVIRKVRHTYEYGNQRNGPCPSEWSSLMSFRIPQ